MAPPPDPLAVAIQLVAARDLPAQLCVIRDDQVIADLAVNCRPGDLFWLFSASKPYVALLVHQLAAEGQLGLDQPVAAYWPKFAQHGKGHITVRQVLQHRSGLPVIRGALGDALAMTGWARSIRAIERARPRYRPGAGAPVRDVLSARFLRPLRLGDTHLGLPPSRWDRHVDVTGEGAAGRLTQVIANRRATREAVIPAAGISATAPWGSGARRGPSATTAATPAWPGPIPAGGWPWPT
ncbi:MAG TPA: serine hydrolase domain-containing protein [Streptosporangiaceae bacterium]